MLVDPVGGNTRGTQKLTRHRFVSQIHFEAFTSRTGAKYGFFAYTPFITVEFEPGTPAPHYARGEPITCARPCACARLILYAYSASCMHRVNVNVLGIMNRGHCVRVSENNYTPTTLTLRGGPCRRLFRFSKQLK